MKLLLSLVIVLATSLASSHAAEKPNILLICVDDLKPLLASYGDKLAKTPHLDRLAARGVQFERAYCNQAVCSPSRNALLTGLRPQTLGIYDLPTHFRRGRPDAITLPQHFKSNGWRSEALGKIFHVGHGNIDDTASWSVESWRPKTAQYALPASQPSEEETKKARAAGKTGSQLPRGAAYESADVSDETYGDGAIATEAVRRLEAAKSKAGEPFFLAVGFLKPHLPFVAPKKYWDLYDPAKIELASVRTPPEGAPDYAPQFGGELRQYADIPGPRELPEQLQRTLIHGYYAATSYMDAQLGRVLDALDRLDLAKNTIVVLWGDHGWHLGDHSMWCKHTNYEQAARIPLLVAAPGAKAGSKTTALAESVDIFPTLCELAGLQPPSGLEGRSFAATLRDPAAPTKEHIIHVYPRSVPEKGMVLGRAIRTARYRLVEWKAPGASPNTAEFELYDYDADPLEKKNVAAAHPQVVGELRAMLAKHPEARPQIGGKADGGKKSAQPSKPPQDRAAAFAKRDKNKDGQLTREEFLVGQPDPDEAPKRFPRFDKNNDGVLSQDEYVRGGK